VEGIGEDFFPGTMNLKIVDDVVQVNDEECFVWARRLAKKEGIFTGGSGGGCVSGALRIAKNCKKGDFIVVFLPDSGTRYLSKIYNDGWMQEHGYVDAEVTISAADVIRVKHQNGKSRDLVIVRPYQTVFHALQNLMAEVAVDAELHIRIQAAVFGEDLGQHVEAGGFIGADHHRSTRIGAVIGDREQRFIAQLQQAFRVREQDAARGGQGNVFAGAVEQAIAIVLLQLADLGAHCRLRTKNFLPGARETAELGNFEKSRELIEIHGLCAIIPKTEEFPEKSPCSDARMNDPSSHQDWLLRRNGLERLDRADFVSLELRQRSVPGFGDGARRP